MGQVGEQDSHNAASDLQSKYESYVRNEKSKKTHKCDYPNCQAVFSRPSKLQRHIRSHTGERPYKCSHPGCTKSYTNSSHLKRHIETHNLTKKVYQCTKCSMALSTFPNLRRHYKRTHCEIFCKECDMTFSKRYQFTKHQANHSASTTTCYKCDKCGKSYPNRSRLNRHLQIHKKSYLCPVFGCLEQFENWSLLNVHKAKHSYKCDTCGKVFLGKYRLKNHSKTHSENRSVLQCTYDDCNRVYFYKFNLDKHVQAKHLGVKFYCDICSKGLTAKKSLEKHIQYHYNKPEKKNKKQQKKRKDAGIPKRSVLSALIGVNFPHNLEKMIMGRETDERYNDNMEVTS